MADYWDLKAKNDKLKQELEANQAALEKAERSLSNDPDILLAEAMHKTMCRHNHTDGCGWYYCDWENPREERTDYLRRAKIIGPMLNERAGETAQEQADYLLRLMSAARGY